MTSEPNLLNRITITIEANNQQVAKKVLHGSLLNQSNINRLINSYFNQHDINQNIYLETLSINLGEINLYEFNSLFPVQLNAALSKALSQYQINNQEENILSEGSRSQKITGNLPLLHDNNPNNVDDFIHYLHQKDSTLNPMEKMKNSKIADINIKQLINQLTQVQNKWTLLLVKSCLSEHSLQKLLAIRQPALLTAINGKLTEKTTKSQYQEELVSSEQLIFNALGYIQRHNIQEIPKPDAKIISLITAELNSSKLNAEPVITLFRQSIAHNTPLNGWLKQLWQIAPILQLCKKHLSIEEYRYLSERFIPNNIDKNGSDIESANRQIFSTLDNTSVTGEDNLNPFRPNNKPHFEPILLPEQALPRQVSNAGILVLWPILPALFNRLGLLEKQKVIHRQAQFSAVDLLDYLIWGTEEIQTERKTLNYVLCGLTANEDTESLSIEPEKQLITEQWLDAIIRQLPSWKKLSRNDARQLFLQRPGELLVDEQEIKITIQPQPFDALLADWPWPLNIAKLPWLDRPLRIDWQNI
ncbi:hypothetical protein LGZ99_04820 [Photorhabdus temperata]|uniref:Uncharacterized protein n=1 Tax=Photorhabdus temperata subsp. temperata Meg1 TaxID=1393735 RepID=A0A081S1J4_PHOTE|nr:contractile injection system tape measure protein [Photorhabdus temperata]KER04797.1 hypothetical protein MEG1DRAFT_00583 [Photorhabdus temperata subsp. temperata Meg1]MCT8346554.1 hypothetical protein [Photorhabdus temperata]